MKRTPRIIKFAAAALSLALAIPARAQERGRAFDAQALFDVYNATDAPAGYRRHWKEEFERSPKRFRWSAAGRASALVAAKDGGGARRDDGASVSVPAGALSRDAVAFVSKSRERFPGENAGRQAMAATQGLLAVSEPVEFGPESVALSSAAALVLPYDPSVVSGGGLEPKSVRAYAWNRAESRWEPLESILNADAGTVTARASRLSVCQVFGRRPWARHP